MVRKLQQQPDVAPSALVQLEGMVLRPVPGGDVRARRGVPTRTTPLAEATLEVVLEQGVGGVATGWVADLLELLGYGKASSG